MCALKIALWKVVDAINQMKLRGFWAQPCDGLWELCKSRPWQVAINHHHHDRHLIIIMVMVMVIIIIILGSRWIVGAAQNRLWQGSEGGMVLASQQERNSSAVKLDSSKWNLKFYSFIRMR